MLGPRPQGPGSRTTRARARNRNARQKAEGELIHRRIIDGHAPETPSGLDIRGRPPHATLVWEVLPLRLVSTHLRNFCWIKLGPRTQGPDSRTTRARARNRNAQHKAEDEPQGLGTWLHHEGASKYPWDRHGTKVPRETPKGTKAQRDSTEGHGALREDDTRSRDTMG